MTGTIAFTGLETGPDDDGGWNLETSGLCSIDRFSRALAVWLVLQDKPQNIGDAVSVFNATSHVIRMAANWRPTLGVASDGELTLSCDIGAARAAMTDSYIWDAIQIIAVAHGNADDITCARVAVVAKLLNIPETRVREVVLDGAPWLYLDGDNIYHEGE